jgi:hypothetical protein
MSVCCGRCMLSGRGLCVGLITCPEESYRLWCVSECDAEASIVRRPWPTGGCCTVGGKMFCVIEFEKYRLSVAENTRRMCHLNRLKTKRICFI